MKYSIYHMLWSKSKRLKYFVLFSLTIFVSCFFILNYYNSLYLYQNKNGINYFEKAGEILSSSGYIIDTPNCKILNINPNDPSILQFYRKFDPPKCSDRKWSFTKGNKLYLDLAEIKKDGYNFDSLVCCYRVIKRVNQSPLNYNRKADLQVRLEDDCIPIKSEETEIEDEFIRVFCTNKYWPLQNTLVYRYFHALAVPNLKNEKILSKINYWKNKNFNNGERRPPNILIFGIDSTSRLNFIRQMPKTHKILEKIGAIEMKGYTKVGENTFPNVVPLLTGYSEEDMKKFCYFNRWLKQDSCPYVWKRFSSANYLTSLIEDIPLATGFNYMKTGFVNEPVDFYYHTFINAVHTFKPVIGFSTSCINNETNEEVLINYIGDVLDYSEKENIPIFAHSWMTNLAHEDYNSAQIGDDVISKFIETRVNLENTILFFMSDHGYRYGIVRQSFIGWMEDKLPTNWIRFPKYLLEKYPKWEENMLINSKRLTSPFDIFWTLTELLDNFSNTTLTPSKLPNGEDYPREIGKSLLEGPISELRTCTDAGILENFCACIIPNKLPLDDSKLVLAAKAAINSLNSNVLQNTSCTQLEVNQITSGAVSENSKTKHTYLIAFTTTPGNFLFEAIVICNDNEGGNCDFSIKPELILRMSKINQRDVKCIQDSNLELYCYCS